MKDQEEQRDPRESLLPFITEARVTAFLATYAPAKSLEEADLTFNTSELRKYFDAYPKTCGDPLSMYIDDYLSPNGFCLKTDPVLRDVVMPVKYKTIKTP